MFIMADKKVKVIGLVVGDMVVTGGEDAKNLHEQSHFGEFTKEGKIQLSLVEALYLLEKGKIEVKGKKRLKFDELVKLAQENEKGFWVRFCIFRDIRDKGYIIKTALKFGAPFRIYERGVKPGEDHAKWIVYPVHERETLTWYEFAAKNRVAHSTKKRLLIGIVDDEGDVTYYEVAWKRP